MTGSGSVLIFWADLPLLFGIAKGRDPKLGTSNVSQMVSERCMKWSSQSAFYFSLANLCCVDMTGTDDSRPLRLRTYVVLFLGTMATVVGMMRLYPEAEALWMVPIVVFIFLSERYFEREDQFVTAILLSYVPYGEHLCSRDIEQSG